MKRRQQVRLYTACSMPADPRLHHNEQQEVFTPNIEANRPLQESNVISIEEKVNRSVTPAEGLQSVNF